MIPLPPTTGVTPSFRTPKQAVFGSGRLSGAPLPRFGEAPPSAEPKPDPQQTREALKKALENTEEHKPSWGKRNVYNAALAALAMVGFVELPEVFRDFHAATQERTEVHSLQEDCTENMFDCAGTAVAEADQFVRDNFLLGTYTRMLEFFLRWEMLWIAYPMLKAMTRKYMQPDAQWADLHKLGYRGQDMSVGIVGEGLKPTEYLPKNRMDLYNLEHRGGPGLLTKAKNKLLRREYEQPEGLQPVGSHDPNGRETAMAGIIAQAMPDSRIMGFIERPGGVTRAMLKRVYDLMDHPDPDPVKRVVHFYEPLIQSLADNVKAAVDKGNQVVIVRQSLDPKNHVENMKSLMGQMAASQFPIARQIVNAPKEFTIKPEHLKELANLSNILINRLTHLPVDKAKARGIKELLAPWRDALDYAYAKGVPVVVPAGDSGAHYDSNPYVVSNMNLLGIMKHPALFVVGSADSRNKVDKFSSEGNEVVQPDGAANGHGQLSTRTRISFDPTWLWMPMKPVRLRLENQMPQGTVYACADAASIMLAMKQLYPDISLEEMKLILAETAHEVSGRREFEDWRLGISDYVSRLMSRPANSGGLLLSPETMHKVVAQLEEELGIEWRDQEKAASYAKSLKNVMTYLSSDQSVGHFEPYVNQDLVDKLSEEERAVFESALKQVLQDVSVEEVLQCKNDHRSRAHRKAASGKYSYNAALLAALDRAEAKAAEQPEAEPPKEK